MNKRGQESGMHESQIWSEILYLLILAVFVFIVLGAISQQKSNAGFWEDFYAKEIARIVDYSSAGTEIELNVHRATEIALKNGVSFSEVFDFDNKNNEIIVKLSSDRKTNFYWFSDVDVVADRLILAKDGKTNVLHFEIVKPEMRAFVAGGENE